ncbi:MAG: PKD domain-containing protein, partial [Bacteroidales bacterium]|nr:PKD domain-containing protein [Bacteroidales bacterium]
SNYEIYFEVDDTNLQNVNYTFTTNNGYWLGSGLQTINFVDNYQGMEVLHIEQEVNTLITLTFQGSSYYYSFVPVLIPSTAISYFFEYQTTNVQNSWGFDWNNAGDLLYFSNYKDLGIIEAGTWQMSTVATNLFSSQLRDVIFSNSGNAIATSSSSKSYKINPTTYQIVAQSNNSYDFSDDTYIGWTNDDSKIIVCTESDDNVVFNSSLGFLSFLGNINDDIHDIAFKPNSNLCAVATEDYNEVNIYNCSGSNWNLVHQIDVGGSNEEVNGVCYNPDGSLLLVSDSEANLVRVYNANNYSEVTTLTVPEWPVQCRWNPDPAKDILAVGCKYYGKIYFFNSDYTLHSIAELPGQMIYRLNWSPDGNVLAANIFGSKSLFLISPFDIMAPTISLTNPPDPFYQTTVENFVVTGNIYDENSVSIANINIPNIGWENLTLDPAGNFQYQVPLVNGINDFTIEAKDIFNQVATYDFQIEKLPASLTASFTSNSIVGFAPLEVQFVDISEAIGTTITDWMWDFGDGNSSIDQYPLHTFQNHGVYSVSLTISDGTLTDTELKTDYINVYYFNPMTVDFSGNPTSLIPGQTVNFTDLSSGNISEWQWTFDGGVPPTFTTTVQGMNPQPITYNSSGMWDVTLEVTDGTTTLTEIKQDYIIVDLQLDLQVFLEGPYLEGTQSMMPYLNSFGYIPFNQPYFEPPWNYQGMEQVTTIPNNNVVDWILIELRETSGGPETAGNSTMIARKAGFLLSDGSITDIDGLSPLTFGGVSVQNNLYAVVWHRNHLAVISNYPLVETGGLYSYVFHDSMDKVYGGVLGHKEINGTWVMISSDGNADMFVNNNDKLDIWNVQAGNSGYYSGDFDVNGNVDNSDKNDKWMPNAGKGSQVPTNTAPTAVFNVSPVSGTTATTFNFDASGSYDPEDPPSVLQVRWDWENDENWDTPYSTTKTATHQYSQPGTYTVKLEVKDSGGLTGNTTEIIEVSIINQPPLQPSNPSPGDGALDQPVNTALSWTCSDPENDPLTYDVYFGISNPPPLVLSGQTANTYNPGTLNYSTSYYWKIVAHDDHTNTTEGQVWNFTTESQVWQCGDNFVDPRDGQIYSTVQIGTQCWLKENMNWETGNSWCHGNDPANCEIYGRLYDWAASLTACPSGWHLPSDDEWCILENEVDFGTISCTATGWRGIDAGLNLKSNTGWNGTNLYGFSALPAGYYDISGSFTGLGSRTDLWSSTESTSSGVWGRYLSSTSDQIFRKHYSNKENGRSVRCLKN